MTAMVKKYKGTFTDAFGTTEIVVVNDFDILSVEVDGIRFEGEEFDDFQIIDKEKHTIAQLQRFTFIEDTICDYKITVFIPQVILNKQNDSKVITDLIVEYKVGKPTINKRIESRKIKLLLNLGNEKFEGTSEVYIDDAFDKIINQFKGKYAFKNCYGCLYSDYSPYGQQGFGGLFCFVQQKEKYLKVKIPPDSYKYDYISEFNNGFDVVQEIYCCDKYKIRKSGVGYRG
ncbi:MAG: hypothetical protein HRT69_08275 [Flavobacteriaceae bacterium]|nr:hypothetical protein [Flavobacteriaceae bacterium]